MAGKLKGITLDELRKENYFFKWYYHFKASLALYDRTPFRIALYRSGASKETMIIFMEDANKNTHSRKVSGNIADMSSLRAWLAKDFEEIEIEYVNYGEGEKMLAEYIKQKYRDD